MNQILIFILLFTEVIFSMQPVHTAPEKKLPWTYFSDINPVFINPQFHYEQKINVFGLVLEVHQNLYSNLKKNSTISF